MSATHDREAELTDYVDGQLGESARGELEATFADDPELARELEDARAARSLLGSLEHQPVPRDFLRKARRKVRRRSARLYDPGRELLRFRLSIEVFAVIAVAVMLALYFIGDLGRQVAPDLRLEHDGGTAGPVKPPSPAPTPAPDRP